MWSGAFDGDGEAIRDDEQAVRWGRGNGWFDHLESRDRRGDSDDCNCIDSCGIRIVYSRSGRKDRIGCSLGVVGKQMSWKIFCMYQVRAFVSAGAICWGVRELVEVCSRASK